MHLREPILNLYIPPYQLRYGFTQPQYLKEASNVNLSTETFENLIHKIMVTGWYEIPAGDVAVLYKNYCIL